MSHLPSPEQSEGSSPRYHSPVAALSPASTSSTVPKSKLVYTAGETRKGRWTDEEKVELLRVADEFLATNKEDWAAIKKRLTGDAKGRTASALKLRYSQMVKERKKNKGRFEGTPEEEIKVDEDSSKELRWGKGNSPVSPPPALPVIPGASPAIPHAVAPEPSEWSVGEDAALVSTILSTGFNTPPWTRLFEIISKTYLTTEGRVWTRSLEEIKARWVVKSGVLGELLESSIPLVPLINQITNRLTGVFTEVLGEMCAAPPAAQTISAPVVVAAPISIASAPGAAGPSQVGFASSSLALPRPQQPGQQQQQRSQYPQSQPMQRIISQPPPPAPVHLPLFPPRPDAGLPSTDPTSSARRSSLSQPGSGSALPAHSTAPLPAHAYAPSFQSSSHVPQTALVPSQFPSHMGGTSDPAYQHPDSYPPPVPFAGVGAPPAHSSPIRLPPATASSSALVPFATYQGYGLDQPSNGGTSGGFGGSSMGNEALFQQPGSSGSALTGRWSALSSRTTSMEAAREPSTSGGGVQAVQPMAQSSFGDAHGQDVKVIDFAEMPSSHLARTPVFSSPFVEQPHASLPLPPQSSPFPHGASASFHEGPDSIPVDQPFPFSSSSAPQPSALSARQSKKHRPSFAVEVEVPARPSRRTSDRKRSREVSYAEQESSQSSTSSEGGEEGGEGRKEKKVKKPKEEEEDEYYEEDAADEDEGAREFARKRARKV
ncbi:hypothetical protein JCM10213_003819 [Rhodosporidiobolus nylandii]